MLLFIFVACQSVGSETGGPPATVKDTDVYSDPSGGEASARFVLSTQMLLNRSGRLFVYDREQREEVWSLENPGDPVWPDARLSPDGRRIWHNVADVRNHDSSLSEIVSVDVTGAVDERYQVDGAHHSFDFLGDGRIVTLVTEYRTFEEHGKVAGDRVAVLEDGMVSTLFSAFSVLEPEPVTDMWDFGHFEDAKDWTHADCIRWNEDLGRILVTVPGLNALWSLDSEGSLKAVYLGAGMEREPYENGPLYAEQPFEIYEGGLFDMPHGATLDSEGNIWVLSNGLGGQSRSFAEGYRPDGEGLELIAQIPPPVEGAHSAGLGGVVRLPGEDRAVINWGILGIIEEAGLDASRHWSVEGGLQEVYGNSTVFDDLSAFLEGG